MPPSSKHPDSKHNAISFNIKLTDTETFVAKHTAAEVKVKVKQSHYRP
jgi:hypothetical protein